jgi:hypothetical protein
MAVVVEPVRGALDRIARTGLALAAVKRLAAKAG